MRSARALEVTGSRGVEPAMEWLLAHIDDPIDSTAGANSSGSAADQTLVLKPADGESAAAAAAGEETAKSIKCTDCDRLFQTQSEVEFHAAKTGHINFTESTEEKRPLTEEEKRNQLAKLEEKLRQKRAERDDREKADALERERLRIRSGKDMGEARRKMEEQEMKKIVDQRKREKQDEKVARDRVRVKIEADKLARKNKLA